MLKQKTVYFREEDLPLWESISNKAEWLHEKLAGAPSGSSSKKVSLVGTQDQPLGQQDGGLMPGREKPVEQQPALVEQAIAAFSGSLRQCKDGHTIPKGRDRCLVKGCKYS